MITVHEHIALLRIEKQDPELYSKIEKVVQSVKEEFPAVVQKDFRLIKKAYEYFNQPGTSFERNDRDILTIFVGFIVYSYFPEKMLGDIEKKTRPGIVSALIATLDESKFIISSSIKYACLKFKHDEHGFRRTILHLHRNHSEKIFTYSTK